MVIAQPRPRFGTGSLRVTHPLLQVDTKEEERIPNSRN